VAGRLVVLGAALVTALGCSAGTSQPTPTPPRPIPSVGLAGREVSLYPLTMLVADRALGWETALSPRTNALATADSLIAMAVTERAPEVTWILPDVLRRTARQAPGMFANPDQMGTAVLRDPRFDRVPDPLRSDLRLLTGATGDRLAMIPASLLFVADSVNGGRAELSLVLVDVRTGQINWRSVARFSALDPWEALTGALESILPVVP